MPKISVDAEDFAKFGRALRAESDGKYLKRDLSREIRAAVRPATDSAKAAVKAIPSHGGPRDGAALRQAVAQQVRPQIRYSGKSAGVSVRVGKRNMPRGFKNAPRRLNRGQWRHPVYLTGRWVTQTIRPGWFDETMRRGKPQYRRGVERAVSQMANRLASRGSRL